jgi:hypothetical protein
MFESGLQELETSSFRPVRRELRREGWRLAVLPRRISDKRSFLDGLERALPLDVPLEGAASWDVAERALGRALVGLAERVAVLWPRADRMAGRRPEDFAIARRLLAHAAAAAQRADGIPTDVAVVVFSRRMLRPEPPFIWQGRS